MGKTRIVWLAVAAQLLMACANKGAGPQGGPQDVAAPRERTCSPTRNATNVYPKRVELWFDENIQLKDAQKNIVVSPPQEIAPVITANGKKLTVEFNDTLRENTTYSIDFGNAVCDLNEGNALKGYTYAFSTGASIDNMEMSGTVLNAQTLSPMEGMIVGLYEPFDTARQDSVGPRYRMPARIARSDENGKFTIRNVKEGRYEVFALKDANGDYLYTEGEMFGWLDSSVTTRSEHVTVNDTVWRKRDSEKDGAEGDSMVVDSIVQRTETLFYPNDLLLLASMNKPSRQRVVKTTRPMANRVDIYMQETSETAPRIALAEGDGQLMTTYNTGKDSIKVWIADSATQWTEVVALTVTYERQDSAGSTVTETDTVKARYNIKNLRRQVEKERVSVKGNAVQLTLPKNKVQEWETAVITSPAPMTRFDAKKVHLLATADSVWKAVGSVAFIYTSADTAKSAYTKVNVRTDWKQDMKYKVEVDSDAVTTIDGKVNDRQQSEWTIDSKENYANLVVFVMPEDDALTKQLEKARLQLLSDHDDVVSELPYEKDGTRFEYVQPDTYFLRMYVDENGDERYTPGDWMKNRQAEATYYMKEGMKLRANWDVEQEWNPSSKDIETMKPKVLLENEKD